jgi:hypothetical protein
MRCVSPWLFALLVGCGSGAAEEPAPPIVGSASAGAMGSETARAISSAPAFVDDPAWAACAARRAEAARAPALSGAPELEHQSTQLARVRARALLWKRAPAVPPALEKLARGKKSTIRFVRGIKDLLDRKGSAGERRGTVLSEGYLFAHDVTLGVSLSGQVKLTRLFDEDRLFIERGVDVYELAREPATKLDGERYVYKGGLYDGERAEVLFGDRVAVTREELSRSPALVVDLSELAARSPFDRIRPVHRAATELVADVRYGPGTWVPALFTIDGAKATLACEALSPELARAKERFVEAKRPLRAAMPRVRAVVRQMVREKIPFDADTDRENGYLRAAWLRAYLAGWRTFNFEGESHEVYSPRGEPLPPEVCIDFLTDVWERASGTWYRPAVGDPLEPNPLRTKGAIDFDALQISNRRSVAAFTEFALQHADRFDVWEIPPAERIPFRRREEFFAYLGENADQLEPGDMLTIGGYKEGGRPHYHSVIVLEVDPRTGIPILVASNAAVPREQSLEGVMSMSPKRTLRHRVRVREPWLSAVAQAE